MPYQHRRITPFVVIPGKNLHQVAVYDFGKTEVNDGTIGSPMMSVETNCSLDTLIIPCHSGFCDSTVKISFISSALVFLLETKVRSISEPIGTGTLTATPSKIPFISGMALAAEIAAPVLDGEISIVPARPLRQSLASGLSTIPESPCKRG